MSGQDLRQALRVFRRQPGFAAIAVLALGLGLGLTATMWSIVYGGMLRGLPFEDADRIVHASLILQADRDNRSNVPLHLVHEWQRTQRSLDQLGYFYDGTVNLAGLDGPPERFEGAFMTPAALALTRVQPLLGRLFTEAEQGPASPHVVIIGYDLWRTRFEADSNVIGRTLRANGETWEIVGVMPAGFEWPMNSRLWLPMRMDVAALPWGTGQWLDVVGRLKPGVTMRQAENDLAVTTRPLAEEHPDQLRDRTPWVQPYPDIAIGPEPATMLWTMMGAVLAVLLIACSNVANLLLARAATRTREVAVRTALGAGRWRIVSQLLTETLVLAGAGALVGIGIAFLGVRWFRGALTITDIPFWIRIQVDGPVLGFTLLCTGLAALAAGLLPAVQVTRGKMHEVLKDEGRGSSSLRLGRFSRGLVVAELALASGLLVAAGFMIQSVVQRSRFDYGVPVAGVYTGRIGLFETTYPDSASRRRFWHDVEQRLAEIPGTRGVGLTAVLPGLDGWWQQVAIDGVTYQTERDYPSIRRVAVSPGFFGTFELTALEGRLFTEQDAAGTLPVAVVTPAFVSKFFPEGGALGKRVRIGGAQSTEPWLTIVGIVPQVWYQGTDADANEPRELMFTPVAQGDFRFLSLAVRAGGDPQAMAGPVRAAIAAVDPDQPVYFARTLEESIEEDGWFFAVFGQLFAAFGVAALVLAVLGVYGVMSFAVRRRTQEVGIRMALGAATRDVLKMFVRQGALQVGLGTVLGLGLAWLLASGMRAVMFEVNTANPFMYAGVSLSLIATGILATLIPARRAMRVDPMIALRYE